MSRRARMGRRSRAHGWPRRVAAAIFFLIVLDLCVCAAGTAVGAYEALAVRRELTAGTSGIGHLADKVAAARDRLDVAVPALGLARLCWWPWRSLASSVAALGGPTRVIGAVGPLLDLAYDGATVASAAIRGALPALSTVGAGHHAPGQAGVRLLAGLQSGSSHIHEALSALERLDADRKALDPQLLPASLRAQLPTLDRYMQDARDALHLAVAAPDLLGSSRPRAYLLVPQNPWDLRATGGFAGTVALLDVRGGRVRLASYEPSDQVDIHRTGYLQPPLPLTLYAHVGNWFYRDANWSPDFPTSAALLRYFYWMGSGRQPDGVIAFDTALLAPLLRITGPLQVPGRNVVLRADTAVRTLDSYVNSGNKLDKSFAGAAYLAIFKSLSALPSNRLSDAARAIDEALREKHLLVWLPNSSVAPILARHGWDGAINATRGDFLYVVDTNVHYNKINQFIGESIAYTTSIQADRSLHSTLTISFDNSATLAKLRKPQNNTLYEDYLRVYVPLGSRLVSTSGFVQLWPTARAHNKQLFAGYLRVPSLHRVTVSFSYIVPPNALLNSSAYELTVQKQPGAGQPEGGPVMLTTTARSGAAGILVGGGGAWSWSGVLSSDLDLTTSLSGGHAEPVPLAYDANTMPSITPGVEIEPGVLLPRGATVRYPGTS